MLACGAVPRAAGARSLESAGDRPGAGAEAPPVEKRTLSNGLQVWVMGVHKVPTVHLELAVRAGIAADPARKFGLASLAADMLDEGAGSRNALEIADAIDFLGAELSATGAVDATYVDLHVPVARLGRRAADHGGRRRAADVSGGRAEAAARGTARLAARDPGRSGAADPGRLPALVFGPTASLRHRRSIGTAASLKAITVADLKAFHAAHTGRRTRCWSSPATSPPTRWCRSSRRAFGGWKGTAARSRARCRRRAAADRAAACT